MLKLMIPAAVLALAGCATAPPVLTAQQAEQMSVVDLCLGVVTFRPNNAATAYAEVMRRGINCQDHQQAIQAVQQQRGAAAAAAMGMYRPIQPYQLRPYQTPPRTNCSTVRIGDSLQTSCQ